MRLNLLKIENMNRYQQHNSNDAGNVLFMILIAVAALASLTFSVMQSQRGASLNLNKEQVATQIDEMISYAALVERGLNAALLEGGCDLTEVSFDHPDRPDYNSANQYLNPNSPVDYSCHIFDPDTGAVSGGGVPYKLPPSLSVSVGTTAGYEIIRLRVDGIGTSNASWEAVDLVLAAGVTEDMCILINDKLGITNPSGTPPVEGFVTGDFPKSGFERWPYDLAGSPEYNGFPPAGGALLDGPSSELTGKKAGCFESTYSSNEGFQFYYVILAR